MPLEPHVPGEGSVEVVGDGVVVESRVVDHVNLGGGDRLMDKESERRDNGEMLKCKEDHGDSSINFSSEEDW